MKLLRRSADGQPDRVPFRDGAGPGGARPRSACPGFASAPPTPFAVELRAHRMGEDVYLEGTITGSLELECSRCLARYRHAAPRALPTRSRARRIARSCRSGGGRGAGARRHVPRRRARDGLVPRRRRSTSARSCARRSRWRCRSSRCVGRIARGCVRTAGPTATRGRCGCAENEPESPFAVLAALRLGPSGGRS